jgi:hypothetical protein
VVTHDRKKRSAQEIGRGRRQSETQAQPALSSSLALSTSSSTSSANQWYRNDEEEVNVRQIVVDLTAALTTKQRYTVLHGIRQYILPHEEYLQWFIELGGASLLWSQLGILVCDRPWTTSLSEITNLLQILHDVVLQKQPPATHHQCSTKATTMTRRRIDRSTLLQPADLPDHLQWLEQTIHLYDNHFVENNYHNKCNNQRAQQHLHTLVYCWMALLHWVSACPTGTQAIIQCPTLLHALVTWLGRSSSGTSTITATRQEAQEQQQVPVLNHEQRQQLFSCFKNLTYFDKLGTCWGQPQFAQHLTMASTTTSTGQDNARIVAAIWRNLALLHTCRTRFTYEVDMPHILYTLATLNHDNCKQDGDSNGGTRGGTSSCLPNVLATAVYLCMDQQVCLAFLLYGDGLYTTLLQSCLETKDDDSNINNNNDDAAIIRKRAARLIRLWATHEISAHLVVQNSTLMGVLSGTAIHEHNPDVRREAAEAFGKVAAWIQSPMPQHEAVLTALEQLVQSVPAVHSGMVARTLLAQTAIPTNRTLVGKNPVLVQALISIALDVQSTTSFSSSLARHDAFTALQYLTQEPSFYQTLLQQESRNSSSSSNNNNHNNDSAASTSSTTITRLLDALTLNLPAVPAAACIVVQLVQHSSATEHDASSTTTSSSLMTVVSQHDGLLKALIRCAGQPHHPYKTELKVIVLQLVEAL